MSAQEQPVGDVAIVLSGGGARAAYQVGLLRCLAELAPEYRFPIITGVSAGALNAVFLAASQGGLAEASQVLSRLWGSLRADRVFRTGGLPLARNVLRWGTRLVSGGAKGSPPKYAASWIRLPCVDFSSGSSVRRKARSPGLPATSKLAS